MGEKSYSIEFAIMGALAGNFAKTFKEANTSVQGLNQKINELNKQAKNIDGVVKLRQESVRLAQRAANQHKALDAVRQSIQHSKAPTSEQIQLERKLSAQYEKTKRNLDSKRGALKSAEVAAGTNGSALQTLIARNEELAQAAKRARSAQEKLAQINEKAQKATDYHNRLQGKVTSSFSKLSLMAAAATGPISVPIQASINMEDAMAEVKKVVNFDTPDGLKNLQKQLEEMSLRIPMTADGLAKIAAAAGQSGIAAKDLAGFTEQAAKMAVAYDMSADEAGEMMSKWKSGMGLSLEQTYKLADATNFLSNNNAALASQVGDVLKRYGALGKIAGLTETQTAAFAASVIASGASSETAATGMKAFMRAMGKGGSMSEVQKAAFKNAGLDPKELQKNLQKDAPATIIETLEAIQKKIPKEKWNQYLSVMFGEEAAVAVGPMMKNLDGLKKNFAMVADEANYSGSMLKEFESRSATTSNSLTLAKNAAYYAARALGDGMLEPIRELSSMFVGVAQTIGNVIKSCQGLVTFLFKVAAGAYIVIGAIHAARMAVATLLYPITAAFKAYHDFQKIVGLANLALATGEKLTLAQRAALIANTVATKVATFAQEAWTAAKNGTLLAFLKEKVALAANKATVLAHTAAVKASTVAQKAWSVALTVGPLVAQTAALVAHKGAMLAWKSVCVAVTVAQKALNLLFVSTPIGWIVTAIGGLVAAGVALYQNWDSIKEKVKELWEWIANFFGKIGETIAGTWEKVKSFFGFGGKKTTVNVAAAQSAGALGVSTQDMSRVAAQLSSPAAMSAQDVIKVVAAQSVAQTASQTPQPVAKGAAQSAKTAANVVAAQSAPQAADPVANTPPGKLEAHDEKYRRSMIDLTYKLEKFLYGSVAAEREKQRRLKTATIAQVDRDYQSAVALKDQKIAASKARLQTTGQAGVTAAQPVVGLASGGIATAPTMAMIGEGRESEAVLPLSKLDGMLGRASATSNSVSVNLTVNVSGASQDAYAEVKRGIAEGSASLKRELERLLNDQRRLSYV